MREIDESRRLIRPTSQFLENNLGVAFPVLDHGFVRIIDFMGDDEAIVQAARVSYGSGTETKSDSQGLINYLMRHRHSTPFEMCEIKLHVKLPVFVARQWIRHRTANVNEYSARYSILDREFYIPEPERIQEQSKTNGQGSGEVFPVDQALNMVDWIKDNSENSYNLYENQLNDGLSRELARINLPTNIYTQWYWKVDLHNLFHFLSLRADPHAQWEIRVYADLILNLISRWVPKAWAAFIQYRMDALTFSGKEIKMLEGMLDTPHGRIMMGAMVNMDITKIDVVAGVPISKGEWGEFLQKLERLKPKVPDTETVF